jgi:hypothetical protein
MWRLKESKLFYYIAAFVIVVTLILVIMGLWLENEETEYTMSSYLASRPAKFVGLFQEKPITTTTISVILGIIFCLAVFCTAIIITPWKVFKN